MVPGRFGVEPAARKGESIAALVPFLRRLFRRGLFRRRLAGRRPAVSLRRLAWLVLPLLLAGSVPVRGAPPENSLMVSAAVSLTEPLREIKALFLREHPGIQIALNLGGSGLLQAQIEQGAPADVFISAGLPQMDRLVAGGFVDSASVRILARNHLVLIVPAKGAPPVHSLADLLHPDVRRIAIGNEKSVPAGQYAGETLRKMDLMDRIQEKLVPGEDVRQVVQYVATGAAEAGFVYLTDARTSAGVRIALTIPDETHSPIVYPIAPIARSDRARLAAEFVALALGPDGRAILVRYGFP